MGQNESRSTTTTTAVTPVVTPSKSRFLAVVHHPPSSEMSNDLNNKTCNTTTKFLVPQNRCRRSSDIGDLIRRKRSPSPQHCQTLKFRGINSRRRRLSADDHTSAAASPPSSAEVVLNDFSMSSSSPKKSPNRGRRKSSISIILPSFIGGKRKFFKVIEENQGPPQIPSNEIFVDLDVYSKNSCDDDEEELIRRRNTSRRRAKSINPMHNTAERRQIQQAVNSRKNPQIVPTVFKYHFKKNCNITAPSCVYLAGSMTKWKSQEMGVLKDESYFISVIECTPGKYFYKFCVDGVWCHDESQPFITSSKKDTKGGSQVN